jgi:hypothetical protein
LHKGLLDVRPFFTRGILDSTGFLRWPPTRAVAVSVDPLKNLLHCQPWKNRRIPYSALFSKEFGQ